MVALPFGSNLLLFPRGLTGNIKLAAELEHDWPSSRLFAEQEVNPE